MDDDQQFCLRWNNHQSTLISVFDTLLEKGIHVDCTLAAEGQTLNAHKVVLSACSPYFEAVLSQQYNKHPIIILKDVKFAELRAMMDYMYRGEVNISQDQLGALLKAAESLQIKGLSDNKPPPPPTPRAVSPPLIKVRSLGPSPGPDAEDDSREGSISPSRRKRKRRRTSLSPAPAQPACPASPQPAQLCSLPAATISPHSHPVSIENDTMAKIKLIEPNDDSAIKPKTENNVDTTMEPKSEFGFDGTDDSVEDLTLDEEVDSEAELSGAGTSQAGRDASGQGFGWHMERSQDELSGQDGLRDSQDGRVTRSSLLRQAQQKDTFGVPAVDLDLDSSLINSTDYGIDSNDSSPVKTGQNIETTNLKNKECLDSCHSNSNIDCESKLSDTSIAISDVDNSSCHLKINNSQNRLNRKFASLPCAQYVTSNGYKCPNCQRTYNARKNLVRHINLECGREPQYKCPHCPHGNHRRNELKRHIEKKHTANLP